MQHQKVVLDPVSSFSICTLVCSNAPNSNLREHWDYVQDVFLLYVHYPEIMYKIQLFVCTLSWDYVQDAIDCKYTVLNYVKMQLIVCTLNCTEIMYYMQLVVCTLF